MQKQGAVEKRGESLEFIRQLMLVETKQIYLYCRQLYDLLGCAISFLTFKRVEIY